MGNCVMDILTAYTTILPRRLQLWNYMKYAFILHCAVNG